MRRNYLRIPLVIVSAFALVAVSQGCGNNEASSNFADDQDAGAPGSKDGSPLFAVDGSKEASGPCQGLQCQQVACMGGAKTTVTGKVYDPAMANPLYNAVVYVPNTKVEPFKEGATCETCGALATGDPIASAITDATGTFVLENVPVGDNIPIVVQLGKWRRQVVLPKVSACVDNPVTDKNVFRLPRNKSEGDIPKMAIATGGADPFECLLLKMGIDTSEFTVPSGTGRISYYVAQDGAVLKDAPDATTLWSDAETLKKYDIVLLPCEGDEFLDEKPLTSRQALVSYANAGGRVFTTHYGYSWLAGNCTSGPCGADPFPTTAQWTPRGDDTTYMKKPSTGTVVTSFPKGQAFADWLQNVGATTTKGQFSIQDPRNDVKTENHPPSQRWITATNVNKEEVVMHLTFNTPIDAKEENQCGRVVYSDFHVSATERIGDNFPASCQTGPMTPQEQALEFMLFDLSSCIQVDEKPPAPPPIL